MQAATQPGDFHLARGRRDSRPAQDAPRRLPADAEGQWCTRLYFPSTDAKDGKRCPEGDAGAVQGHGADSANHQHAGWQWRPPTEDKFSRRTSVVLASLRLNPAMKELPYEPTSTMILAQQDEVATTPTLECAKTTPNNLEVEEAKARTAAFLASVSQALQWPLADLPFRRDACTTTPAPPTPAPTLRRSDRLANQPLNSMVRASKKVFYNIGDMSLRNIQARISLIMCITTILAMASLGGFQSFAEEMKGLMMVVVAIVPDFLLGVAIGCGIQGLLLLSCGFFRLPDDLPKPVWKYPLYFISYHKYGIQGLYKNEFIGLAKHQKNGNRLAPDDQQSRTGLTMGGDHVLQKILQIDTGYSKWVDLAILCAMVVVCRATFLAMVKLTEMRGQIINCGKMKL
nr:unnamed protein product [Digitaria exilis]